MASGLTLDGSLDDLALRYQATLQALAYGTRHIVQALNQKGYEIKTLLATGGGAKNPLWLKSHADAAGCELLLGKEGESVLLGAAIQGAVASGFYPSIPSAMRAMSSVGRRITPDPKLRAFHDAKYKVFLKMYSDQLSYRSAMVGL